MNSAVRSALLENIRNCDLSSGHVTAAPEITWRPTFRCNARCEGCRYWQSAPLDFPSSRVPSLIEEMQTLGTKECLLIGGEPTLYSSFGEILSRLREAGIRPVVFTNGIVEDDTVFDVLIDRSATVISSLDSNDPATHDQIRGRSDAHAALCRLAAALRNQSATFFALNTVVSAANYRPGFVGAIIDAALELGAEYLAFSLMDFALPLRAKQNQSVADHRLSREAFDRFVRELHEARSAKILLASNPDLSFAAEEPARAYAWYCRGRYGLPTYAKLPCWESWNGANLLPNGDVYPCLSAIETPRYRLGNIVDTSLASVLNGDPARRYRVARHQRPLPVCLTCKDHQTKNADLARAV